MNRFERGLTMARETISEALRQRWTFERANGWYAGLPWLVGANFVPSTAINQLEMWQEDTFDPARIDLELGWAERLGMNTMRVFLHDLLWKTDAHGLVQRLDRFLTIASRHGIKPSLVLFDSCWNPSPKAGRQPEPVPGIHNSGWAQSPGMAIVSDAVEFARLQPYVEGIIGAFAHDDRVLYWDLWNEPCNTGGSWTVSSTQREKARMVAPLLEQTFAWARNASPDQPLTSGIWGGDACADRLNDAEMVQLLHSDILTFHSYASLPRCFEERIIWLQSYNRPVICTEFLARGDNNVFDSLLPMAKEYRVGMVSWGLVAGKTQTFLPWNAGTMESPVPWEDDPGRVWHHELLHADGRPYKVEESWLLRGLARGETFVRYALSQHGDAEAGTPGTALLH